MLPITHSDLLIVKPKRVPVIVYEFEVARKLSLVTIGTNNDNATQAGAHDLASCSKVS